MRVEAVKSVFGKVMASEAIEFASFIFALLQKQSQQYFYDLIKKTTTVKYKRNIAKLAGPTQKK